VAGIAVVMPRLGMTMEEGTVLEWPVAVGARVEKGAVLLVIETEKAETEIEAVVAGTLRHVYAESGTTLACGALLAALTENPEEAFDADAFSGSYLPPEGARSVASPAPAGRPVTQAEVAVSDAPGRRPVAPAARALARKLGLVLDRIAGTGPNGRLIRSDVEAYAAARERLVSVEDGVGLELLREGAGDPVVLLPGFGSDLSSFALLTPLVSGRFETIGIHPRGVGSSDAPAADVYPLDQAAADAAAVLSGPSHLVGASLGAAVALEVAFRTPERVRSLTLITPFVEVSARLAAFTKSWCQLAAELSPEHMASFLAPWLFGEALLADAAACSRTLRGLTRAVLRVPPATLERSRAGMLAWSGSRTSDLARLSVPTLVLAAGADLLTPDAERIAAAIPGAALEVFPDCGHALAIEAADGVARCLLAHLAAGRAPARRPG